MKEHSPDPYTVLHLDPAATEREISRAYRALVRARHPDTRTPRAVAAGPDSGPQEPRDQELRDIMDAYAVLRDPVKRAAYDRQRAGSPRSENVPVPRHRQGPSVRSTQGPSGAALIIGPVRWERREARDEERPAPGGYQMPWWILH
jgi:curved DNA-binding protein CbpA